jgi:lipopolysaccharide/colanic/teichoic acid biosynthesis glycosyltransferase
VITAKWTCLSPEAQAALRHLEATSAVQFTLLPESLGFDSADATAIVAASPLPNIDPPRSSVSAASVAEDGAHDDRETALNVSGNEREALKRNTYWTLKRGLDMVAALGLIVLLAPVMLLVMLLALVDVGRPVVFWQQRPGLGGRPFRLYKVRTMRAAHDETGQLLPDSARLSSIGRFLRATRLDELPQLFHILVGQMSFVGPRPLLPVDQPVGYAARLLVRPGLTGWAQVKGGRHLSAIDKAALDVWYVRNASLRLDLEIVFRTALMVLFGEKTNAEAIRNAWDASPTSQVGDYVGDDALALAKRRMSDRRVA